MPEGTPRLFLSTYVFLAFGLSGPRPVAVVATNRLPSVVAIPQVFPYKYGLAIGIVIFIRSTPPSRSAIAPPVSERRVAPVRKGDERTSIAAHKKADFCFWSTAWKLIHTERRDKSLSGADLASFPLYSPLGCADAHCEDSRQIGRSGRVTRGGQYLIW